MGASRHRLPSDKIKYLRRTVRRYPLEATAIAGLLGFVAGEGASTSAFKWLLTFSARIAARETVLMAVENFGASHDRHHSRNNH